MAVRSGVDGTVLVLNYNEIDFFPPTINAIHILASFFDKVLVLEITGRGASTVVYPGNVMIHRVHRNSGSAIGKIRMFISFIRKYLHLLKKSDPKLVLFYDAMSGATVNAGLKLSSKRPVLWYHNHDVIQPSYLKKYSLLRWGYHMEQKLLRHLQVFTLPADERKASFNFHGFTGYYSLIPNYPSKYMYQHVAKTTLSPTEIRVIYQGNINVGHGIEEMLDILPSTINGKTVRLILIGFIFGDYRERLSEMIKERDLAHFVELKEPVSYHVLPSITNQQHIGLAVYTGKDIMNVSLGTASNKIYEYTACGMPFLYYDAPHFNKHLADMPWAIPTDLSGLSLVDSIRKIDDEYALLSLMARKAFEERLHFENVFVPVLNHALELIRRN